MSAPRPVRTADLRGRGQRRRPRPARRRRVPEGDGADPRARARPARRASGRPPGAAARHLPRHAAAVRVDSTELGGAEGLGLLAGDVSRARTHRPEGAPHRLGAGALGARVASSPTGSRDGDALLLRPLASSPARPTSRRRRSAPRSTASGSPRGRTRPPSTALSSTRRSRAPRGCGCCANFTDICAPAPASLDPLPGDRHPRRSRRAAGPGRLRPRDRVRRRPGRRGAALGRPGRRCAPRRRPRRRPRGRPGRTSTTCDGSARSPRFPSRSAAACASADAVDEVLEAGADRAMLGTAALADPALVDALTSEHGERIVVSADSRAGQGRGRGLGAGDEDELARADPDARRARGAELRLHAGRGRRDARGSRARWSQRKSPVRRSRWARS